MKVAVFGLGIIGQIWAQHYEADGVLGATWNRTVRSGAPRVCVAAAEAASQATLLHICVADPPAVEAVLRSLLPVLGPDKVVVQSSTIDPTSSESFARLVEGTGAGYVEAPFTGSKPAAEARQTVFFLGGEAPAVERADPMLARLSKRRFLMGAPSRAAAVKLAMNLQIACVMEAHLEGLAFAQRLGLSDDTFFEVLRLNVSCSGLVDLKERKLRERDYAPQFSVKHLLKDLRLALNTPGAGELPATALVARRLADLAEEGLADEDFSALQRLLDAR